MLGDRGERWQDSGRGIGQPVVGQQWWALTVNRARRRDRRTMWRTVVLGYALVCVALRLSMVAACPSEVCVCKWKGGKQTVECGGRFLNRMPEGMDPGTQVLNFSGNSLTILQSERFKRMDLINLQKIYLARNQLVKVHDRAFRGLTNLVELDLSDNTLQEVPTETFQDYSALMRLSLSGNPIRALRTSAFKHLSYLTTLELSNCQIELIEDEAFIGMDNLEWLRLDGNRITTIQGAHVLPESLHGINLQSNRWHCDCRLIDIHTWLNSFNVPQREEPKCSSPTRLAGETVKALHLDDLACLPVITPETTYREIAEGRNISLDCRISAVPEPTISWLFQGQLLQNDSLLSPNLHLYYYIEESEGEKRSELFIYNINVDDNGTFSCVAENSAGRVQTNYTLHVIVKEEPVVEQVTFSEEYFLIIIGASAAIGFLVFLIICIIICKCARSRRNHGSGGKKARSKTSSDIGHIGNQKCSSITNDIGEPLTTAKMNGTLGIGEGNPQDVVLYLNTPNSLDKAGLNSMTPMAQFCSPPSARSYQDQNPDLINDAESGNKIRTRPDPVESDVGEKDSDEQSSVQDGGSEASFQQAFFPTAMGVRPPMGPRYTALTTLPRGIGKDPYQHQVDIHLSPGCFLDQNGYPIDLNLLGQQPAAAPPVNYYRTLPHNRGQKGGGGSQKARYANDAEFITRTTQQSYQLYMAPNDVRYTAEGYPQQPGADPTVASQFPSPPEGYKGEVQPVAYMNSTAFCMAPGAGPQQQQWPTFLPGYHPQLIPIATQAGTEYGRFLPPSVLVAAGQHQQAPQQQQQLQQPGLGSPALPVLKKCVSAQTSELDKDVIPEQREEEEEEEAEHENGVKLRHLSGPLADSPDEGYVGDSHETTDI